MSFSFEAGEYTPGRNDYARRQCCWYKISREKKIRGEEAMRKTHALPRRRRRTELLRDIFADISS